MVSHSRTKDFFNHTEEIEAIKDLLKSDPQLSVITGPVNSGKSLLLRRVLQEIQMKEDVPILYLNLRNVSFRLFFNYP